LIRPFGVSVGHLNVYISARITLLSLCCHFAVTLEAPRSRLERRYPHPPRCPSKYPRHDEGNSFPCPRSQPSPSRRCRRTSTPTAVGGSVGISSGTTNYELYRDTLITNRLTQRQGVNVPLMKATIRTLLSRSAEPADVEIEDYQKNGLSELLMNVYDLMVARADERLKD
jgi:hypothetical protein